MRKSPAVEVLYSSGWGDGAWNIRDLLLSLFSSVDLKLSSYDPICRTMASAEVCQPSTPSNDALASQGELDYCHFFPASSS